MASIEDRVRASQDITNRVVAVPEWADDSGDLKIEVRSMTGRERAEILRRAIDPETGEVNYERLYPAIIVATCFDPETGERAFSDAALSWLNEKNSKPLEQLATVGMQLSGISKDAKEEAQATFPERGV
jgi:hypothetical protein